MTRTELQNLYIGVGEFNGKSTPEYVEGKGFAIHHTKGDDITFFDSLGIQTSQYHKEDLMSHVAMVVGRMDDELGMIIGVLHDLGKKYTIKINPRGGVCFYGHEKISADIAAELLNESVSVSEEQKRVIYAVIENHLQLKLLNGSALECFKAGFEVLYGKDALRYLEELDKADEGVAELSSIDKDLVDEGNKRIDEILAKYF